MYMSLHGSRAWVCIRRFSKKLIFQILLLYVNLAVITAFVRWKRIRCITLFLTQPCVLSLDTCDTAPKDVETGVKAAVFGVPMGST